MRHAWLATGTTAPTAGSSPGRAASWAIPGAYSQYTTWFPHSLVKLPDNVTNEEGAMAEPFAVGLHAIQVSQVKPNDRVLILGGGIIGMSCAGVGQNLRRQ